VILKTMSFNYVRPKLKLYNN